MVMYRNEILQRDKPGLERRWSTGKRRRSSSSTCIRTSYFIDHLFIVIVIIKL